ncbi:MAG: glycosyltransferase family 4 protein [bacterium]|nr:glycosyltransferase family 4 protein [bacterium]
MNIAVVAEILNERSGVRATVKLAEALAKLGHRVSYLAFDQNYDSKANERLVNSGVKVTLYPGKRGWVSRWVAAWWLWQQLRREHYAIVSNHSSFPFLLASRFSGLPLIKTYYGTQFYSVNQKYLAETGSQVTIVSKTITWLYDFLIYWREKVVFWLAPKQVAICHFLSEEAKKLYGVDIPHIYLGAESEDFQAEPPHDSGDDIRVLSVSRIVPYKGFHYLIKAVQELRPKYPQLMLQIVGSSPDERYLGYLRAKAGAETEIILSPDDTRLADLYRQCSIYAIFDEWSPWSMTLLEASFFGKPLLAFGRGGFGEVINNGENGFNCQDFADFTKKLDDLCCDDKLRQRLGLRAQELVQRFTWEKCAREYLATFSKVGKL